MDNLSRCLAYIEKLPPAVGGSGGHGKTYRVACECVRFGLTDGEMWQALNWYNDNRCTPPWSEKELRHKMEQGKKKALFGERNGERRAMPKPVTAADLMALSAKRRTNQPVSAEAAWEAAWEALRADASPENCRRYAEAAIALGLPFYADGETDLGADGWREWAKN